MMLSLLLHKTLTLPLKSETDYIVQAFDADGADAFTRWFEENLCS